MSTKSNISPKIERGKYYIHLAGGVGDHMISYFSGGKTRPGPCKGFGFLEQLKEEQPDAEVKLIAHPNQRGAIKEFFKYHPLIDSIEELDWRNPCGECKTEIEESKGYIKLEEYGESKGWKASPNFEVYLSKEDEQIIQEILNNGSFILVHPFAGTNPRISIKLGEYPKIIDKIIDKFNYNVVLIGGSHLRELRNKGKRKTEEFSYKRNGLLNLIGKTNWRVSAKLIQLASAAIVTHSVMFCMASHGQTPCVVITNSFSQTIERINLSYTDCSRIMGVDCRKKTIEDIKEELFACLQKVLSVPK